jgi:branched-chain amino acid transport system substrate-binding protein
LAKRIAAGLALAAALAAILSSCGSAGVSAGATVAVYASAPQRGPEAAQGRDLCAGARRALAAAGGRAGELRVRFVCLDASGPAGAWTLARVGANARRAVEDSTTAAYLGEPDPQARLQSQPILEAAGIADIHTSSGITSMQRVLKLIAANPDSPRQAIFEAFPGA